MKPRPETTLGKYLILEANSKHRTREHLEKVKAHRARAKGYLDDADRMYDRACETLIKAHQYFMVSGVFLVISLLMALFG